MNEFNTILKLLESFLGQSHKGLSEDLQVQFDCPVCSMNKGLYEGDGKHNLEVNLKRLKFNCWVCGQTDDTHGSISKLIRMFGNPNILNEYKSLIYSIRQSKLYELSFKKDDFLDDDNDDDLMQESGILLPYGFKPLKEQNYDNINAFNYLKKRNIDNRIINRFNIGYIKHNDEFQLRERVIIPSYDRFGVLNYWVGRDYSNTSNKWKTKYVNPDAEKSEIIFNENKVNWWGDITLVEGPFDHICVPNSIPMLGKVLHKDSILYTALMKQAKSNVYIFLDDDAYDDAIKIYKLLNQNSLYGRVYVVPCPNNYDAALLFQEFGTRGICTTLKNRTKIPEIQLL